MSIAVLEVQIHFHLLFISTVLNVKNSSNYTFSTEKLSLLSSLENPEAELSPGNKKGFLGTGYLYPSTVGGGGGGGGGDEEDTVGGGNGIDGTG